MKVAIVHYWLVNMRGGEKVVEALCELFPEADIFTHVYEPSAVSDTINRHRVRTSFIQRLPWSKRLYQRYLAFMPLALEQLDLRGYGLVISSESGPAKGVIVSSDTLHICYCHSPMRYAWDMYHDYIDTVGPITRLFMRPIMHYMRLWDFASASRVDHIITNSNFVANRIRKHYRRDAQVIYPPVDTRAFTMSNERGDFYLIVGQLVAYKRTDLAVHAFNETGKPLVVIGDGAQLPLLKKLAKLNITLLGRQPFSVIRNHYARCRALIFPGEEDFGIVPVEAMASGRPVIAFRRGGALETVVDRVTGLFFDRQDPDSLVEALERYERMEAQFEPERIAQHARTFDRCRFKERMQYTIERLLQGRL